MSPPRCVLPKRHIERSDVTSPPSWLRYLEGLSENEVCRSQVACKAKKQERRLGLRVSVEVHPEKEVSVACDALADLATVEAATRIQAEGAIARTATIGVDGSQDDLVLSLSEACDPVTLLASGTVASAAKDKVVRSVLALKVVASSAATNDVVAVAPVDEVGS